MQGATVLSLMCVTLNKATLLFRGSKIGQINQNRVSCTIFKQISIPVPIQKGMKVDENVWKEIQACEHG